MPAVPSPAAARWLRTLPALCAVFLAAAIAVPSAGAFYLDDHEIGLVSRTQAGELPSEIGNATSSLQGMSDDGRYVLLRSNATNFPGASQLPPEQTVEDISALYRKDRQTGALELVARPTVLEEGTRVFCGTNSGNAGISADGRYVAFATSESLVAGDEGFNRDVYVRDMTKSIGAEKAEDEAGAWELVSTRDGGDTPATYASTASACTNANFKKGSDLPSGEVISDDGRRVVFKTQNTKSDLPDRAAADVPAGSLFWRDLDADHTWAVSREIFDAAGDPVAQTDAGVPPGIAEAATSSLPLASISGDGTKVAWVGSYAPSQVKVYASEYGAHASEAVPQHLLWRDMSLGEDGVTRRVIPLIDLDDPACTEADAEALTGEQLHDGEAEGPCYGPMIHHETMRGAEAGDAALSDDGLTVAFTLAGDPRPSPQDQGEKPDVWVTSMASGVSRKEGTHIVTRSVGTAEDSSASIGSVALAGAGDLVAFRTVRREFSSLTSPSPVGQLAEQSETENVYRVSVPAGGTPQLLELVSRGFGGDELEAGEGGPGSDLAISADGETIAFGHGAKNLVEGDTNEATDVFVSSWREEEVPSPDGDSGGGDSGGGDSETPITSPDNSFTLLKKKISPKSGGATISVRVPGPGRLAMVGTAKAGSSASASAKGSFKVGSASVNASKAGTYKLNLKPSRRAKGVLADKGKLKVSLKITFAPTGGTARTSSSSVTLKLKAG